MTSLRILPRPAHTPIISAYDDSDEEQADQPSVSALTIRASLPAYGMRRGWQPMSQDDFGDGGAYPECHVAQYPLDMGRKKVSCALARNIRNASSPASIRLLQETPSRYRLIARETSSMTRSHTKDTAMGGECNLSSRILS